MFDPAGDGETPVNEPAAFRYIDLFAGIGGFHAVLDAMGGECVYAVEIDKAAQDVYEANWGLRPLGRNDKGDITIDAPDDESKPVNVPPHDVLVAGFPCQPFSKSGKQQGMDETRGTLFFNIMRIVRAQQPVVVLLENVRNLAGPRHEHEWAVIIDKLRDAGYVVSSDPAIFSPASLAPEFGGHPQTRDRVFIAATRVKPRAETDRYREKVADERLPYTLPDPKGEWDPITLGDIRMDREWDLRDDLPLDWDVREDGTVSDTEWGWIKHWDAWVHKTREMYASNADHDGVEARNLPGFPVWANVWTKDEDERERALHDAREMKWKVSHLTNNYRLYDDLLAYDADWTAHWLGRTRQFPESRQKFEWQAQRATSVGKCVISLRPSGIRVKRLTHLPALVAISQTPIIGPLKRRLSIAEGARLQGLPDGFRWPQKDAATWKQLGNGVNTGVVARALWAQVNRDEDLLENDERGWAVHDAVTKTLAGDGALKKSIAAAWKRGQERLAESATDADLA
ncbi:DNA (cytosine-5-)-methyltransferase [Cellulosimicrobium sp. Marseille-Q8652]